ncbi:helix-turn-helix transcriptional regulator [Sphingorhabdus sp.]|uniref:helix-turn-helix transcriptional regulator n=1 Tax=Sphingorhabdus sp. TaxID=1902408 RepID=UPI003593335C
MGIEQGHPVTRLSAVQIETLRFVYAHKNSKEIARIMGVSSHTVDERIRTAIRKLGVHSRTKAAILVAEYLDPNTYQPLSYQPSVIGFERDFSHPSSPQQEEWQSTPMWLRPPFPTNRRPHNTDSFGERLLWPVLIAMGTIMAFAALYAVMLGLGAMLS